MNSAPRAAMPAVIHACLVLAAYALLFTWLFAGVILRHDYAAESDLYEYYLPIFLAPITTWSSFEFSGLPAFADPGDFTSYPPHFLFARVIGSWTGLIVSAFVLASAFTYAYVYRVTRSRMAAACAGLAYGMSEAMLERIPHLGTLHCFAWLPLIVLAIDHICENDRPRRWVAVGAVGLACAFLSGHPQPAVYTYYAAGAYALTIAYSSGSRMRAYALIAAMFAISLCLAALKALPLAEASFVMARQQVNYGQFAGHANTPVEMLSALFPTILHDGREAPTYVGLMTLAFAAVGVSKARRDVRAMFWIAAAVVALLIGMGTATPFPRLVYAVVPLYTKFRVGARHLFLLAFGAAFLAGKGISAIQRGEVSSRTVRACAGGFLVIFGAAALFLALSPWPIAYEVRRHPVLTTPIWIVTVWIQLIIALMTAATLWLMSTTRRTAAWIVVAMVVLFGDDLFSNPSPVTLTGISFGTIPRAAAAPSVHAEQIGHELEPLHQRALAFGGTQSDAVLPAAFARLWRIPIAGGYGPMLLERYSQLATMGTNGSVRAITLSPDDTSLDVLSVKYVLMQPHDFPEPATFDRNGITWDSRELGLPVGRSDCNQQYVRRATIPAPPGIRIATIALVTHLRCSEHLPQGTVVATVRSVSDDGRVDEREMRAGIETAETGLGDPTQIPRVQHQRPAEVFVDPDVKGLRALARLTLSAPAALRRIEIETPVTNGWLTIDRLSFVDADGRSHPTSLPQLWLDDQERWVERRRFSTSRTSDRNSDEMAPSESSYTVYENARALPRAWMASDVVSLDDSDALEAVRHGLLPDGRKFDPRRMAIVTPEEGPAPALAGAGGGNASVQRIEDRKLTVAVSSSGGGFLVLSETDYPGWRALIDGRPVPVRRTDLALQGVAIPAGAHLVEFQLASTTQRVGASMSIAGLAICAALLIIDSRRTTGAMPANAG